MHLLVGPVPCLNKLESPLQTFVQPLLQQKAGTSKNQNLQGDIFKRVFIPKPLNNLRPPGNLLYFIYNKEILPKRLCLKSGFLPLALQPRKGIYAQALCKSVCERFTVMIQCLLDGSCLANLSRSCDNLNPKPFLTQTTRNKFYQRQLIHNHSPH